MGSVERVTRKTVWIEDCNRAIREIKPLPLSKRVRFINLQAMITERVLKTQKAISDLYDEDNFIREAIDQCLQLYGLDPDWISAEIMVQLFFAYDGGDGLCWQLEFSQPKGRPLDPNRDPYAAAIAAYWSYHPHLSIGQVMEEIDKLDWTTTEAVFEEINRIEEARNPKLKQKRENERMIQEMLDTTKEAKASGRDIFEAGLAAVIGGTKNGN